MRIFYYSPYYPPSSEAAAVRTFWFVKTLKDSGHEVIVISDLQMKFKIGDSKTNSIIRLFKETLSGMELFVKISRIKNIDRIILSSPPFVTVIIGSFAAKLKKIPFILDIRDLYPEVYIDAGLMGYDDILTRFVKGITRRVYWNSFKIISVTRGLCHSIVKYPVSKDKVHLISNGYDKDIFYPVPIDKKFPKFTLVFHGKIGKIQNMNVLINLAKKLEYINEIEFLIIGDGSRVNEIKDAKLQNIKLMDSIPYQEIPNILRKCHVGLSFRTDGRIGRDAYPVKVFEYIGTGIPIVMTPICEMGRIIVENKLGKNFENDDLNGITQYILDLKENYSSNIPQQRMDAFSRQDSAKKILELI